MDPTRKTSGCDESAHNRMCLTRMIQRQTCFFFHKSLLYCNFYSLQLQVRIFCCCSYSQATYYCSYIIFKTGSMNSMHIQECNALLSWIHFIIRTPTDFSLRQIFLGGGEGPQERLQSLLYVWSYKHPQDNVTQQQLWL